MRYERLAITTCQEVYDACPGTPLQSCASAHTQASAPADLLYQQPPCKHMRCDATWGCSIKICSKGSFHMSHLHVAFRNTRTVPLIYVVLVSTLLAMTMMAMRGRKKMIMALSVAAPLCCASAAMVSTTAASPQNPSPPRRHSFTITNTMQSCAS